MNHGLDVPDDATGTLLRTCRPDGTSRGGFVWPTVGHVIAPDWDPTPACGGGLHGLPGGQGSCVLLDWSPDALWQAVAYIPDEAVDLGGKVKVPQGWVVHTGPRADVLGTLRRRGVIGPLPGDITEAGDGGSATAGYRGSATAGDGGTATAGDVGSATAGYRGTATAGDGGSATVGNRGSATVGNRGTATAGNWGSATAGDWGTLLVRWHDGRRSRITVGYVGEDGIEPGVPYGCDTAGRLIRTTRRLIRTTRRRAA